MPSGTPVRNATSVTITAPMVAPISGIRSSTATISASASAYGTPRICRNTYEVTPAMNAMVNWPATYPPIRSRISSPSSATLARRERGTSW
ncbi:hypothetical protein D3C83_99060 [compost metagenome]